MNKDIAMLITNFNNIIRSFPINKLRLILILLTGLILLPVQQSKSEEIFLKCIGKYQINRGSLIKPDWETTYLTINLDGLISIIDNKGIEKEGRTLIRRNAYTITHRDNRNIVKNIYKINRRHHTYIVESPQKNITLIGTCQKGKG